MEEAAIKVEKVDKIYKLYDKPSDRFKEALGLSRKPKYREHYALKDVSFDVKRGETVGIIGTNGSGKSTILKIITGVLNPTHGNVEIKGRISALLELGAGFNMEYTGIENVYLNGTMTGFSKEEIDEKMDDILAFADIGDFVHQPVKTYSSGMFVRLAFAVAINIDPEILIVDEALSVGDVFFQNKCYRKFEEFKEQGKTILFVSHDLGSISKYCDRVVLLNQGVKIAEGEPREMVDAYKKIMVSGNGDEILSIDDLIERSSINHIDQEEQDLSEEHVHSVLDADDTPGLWKSHFQINPNVNEYGSRDAEIIDFAVLDDQGDLTNAIIKGKKFRIRSKVKFYKQIEDPIFTYTIKTLKGTDVTGTNTMYEKKSVGTVMPGDVYVATFEQEMNLQGGEYLLSISCTGFENGELRAYHRLYDVINITVISDKNTVGYFDMNSKVDVRKVEN